MRVDRILVLVLSFSASLSLAQTSPETEIAKVESRDESEPKPSWDIIVGGQNANVSLGIHGNFPLSGYVNGSVGVATTSIGPADILDLKLGIGSLEPVQTLQTVWSHIFVGQSQILTRDVIGLDKGDSRFWFLEGFVGLGPIGAGFRFNFMKDEDGVYIRKTHIPRNHMFPFLAITSRL